MSSRFYENPLSRSLGLHFLFLLLIFGYAQWVHPPIVSVPIEVSYFPKGNVKLKETESSQHTIVRPTQGKEVLVEKKDAYLSDKTRVVENQTSSKNSGEGVAQNPNHKASGAAKAKTKIIALSDLGMKITQKNEKGFSDDHNWANSQTGEAIQGGQFVQGMKEGDVSALNTKEFVFFSYFDRVRRQLDQAWQPILRENIAHIFRLGRRLASNSNFVTRTLVTLNAKGEIVKVQLLEESGTNDLDQAAVDALNKAGPYPNPPKGLIDSDGKVEIRWDFILKT